MTELTVRLSRTRSKTLRAHVVDGDQAGANLLGGHRYRRADLAKLECRQILNHKIPGVRIHWIEGETPTQ